MINASVAQLRRALDERQISSVELTRLFLARIDRLNPALNAFITVDEEGALAAARQADADLAASKGGPLTGIPLAHKDVFCTAGVLTSCGSKMLANFVSPYDAHVVSLLKAAGSVCLGKTNLDEFAMSSAGENSYFGATKNPWQREHVPGGSSSGSAAAVAARMVPLATGIDSSGSIRQPAAFCGVTGIKPSYGVVSRYGIVPYASSLDQGGALGASAADCALLLTAMSGHDERDSTSLARAVDNHFHALEESAPAQPLAGLRIGLPAEFFGTEVSAEVNSAVASAIRELEQLGATTTTIALPLNRAALAVSHVIGLAESSSNLSRFDGVRYGHRAADYADLEELYCKSRAEGFGAEVKRRLLLGTHLLSHEQYETGYLQAQRLRRLIADSLQQAFDACDLIVGPTTPTAAWKLGETTDDPLRMYQSDMFTAAASLAGLPALSLPCGITAGGLPVGLQLIGTHFSETRLLTVAHRFQQVTDWHQRRPAVDA